MLYMSCAEKFIAEWARDEGDGDNDDDDAGKYGVGGEQRIPKSDDSDERSNMSDEITCWAACWVCWS